MNYCRRCGAYIPDGLSACVACGYDEARETGKQTGKAEKSVRGGFTLLFCLQP